MRQSSAHDVFNTLGASNHSKAVRSLNDFYATPPLATHKLLQLESFDINVWEPACGMNHIADILRENGHTVRTSDIINMLDDDSIEIIDFLKHSETFCGDIITNPPYNKGMEFVEKALEVVADGSKVAMFLKLQFLESAKRYKLFKKYPPKTIYVSVNRLGCSATGEFNENGNAPSAIAYCWYIWEKGFTGETTLKWFL